MNRYFFILGLTSFLCHMFCCCSGESCILCSNLPLLNADPTVPHICFNIKRELFSIINTITTLLIHPVSAVKSFIIPTFLLPLSYCIFHCFPLIFPCLFFLQMNASLTECSSLTPLKHLFFQSPNFLNCVKLLEQLVFYLVSLVSFPGDSSGGGLTFSLSGSLLSSTANYSACVTD